MESRAKALQILDSLHGAVPVCKFDRSVVSLFLFDFLDNIRGSFYPKDWLVRFERDLAALIDALQNTNKMLSGRDQVRLRDLDLKSSLNTLEYSTGEVYFNLWQSFKSEDFHDAEQLLRQRFSQNDIDPTLYKCALDAGCGSGRYSVALRKMGISKVVGMDYSENSINFAIENSARLGVEVDFIQGTVLEIPFGDESFDFVFSNGVLHHTRDTEHGLAEIRRVLRENGHCWLYLYGGKDSFFWDIVDAARKLLKGVVDQNYLQSLMLLLGYPPGRIFHRADFFFVPINNRYYYQEVCDMISKAGFRGYRRLQRGVSHDWDEIIHNNKDIDPYIYGEGEMRFLLSK